MESNARQIAWARQLSLGIVSIPKLLASCAAASDTELAVRLERIHSLERRASAMLVAHLAEFDKRNLWCEAGYPSLFSYCTAKLGMSEQAAYKRIAAARAVKRLPQVLERLTDGRLHLSAVAVLAPHLTDQNVDEVLDRAKGRTKYELEKMVAALHPRPEIRDCVMSLPAAAPPTERLEEPGRQDTEAPSPPPDGGGPENVPRPAPTPDRGREEPLSPGRVHFGFTGSEALREKIKRVKALTWHCDPAGRLEVLIERVVDFYLDRKDPDRTIPRRQARKKRRQEGGPA